MAPKIELGFKDEDQKDLETKAVKLSRISKAFNTVPLFEDEIINKVAALRTIKMPRILHALMSFLGYQREEICEADTNLFSWKKSKDLYKENITNKMRSY